MNHLLATIAAAATLVAAPAFANDPSKPAQEKDPMAKRICVAPHHTTGTMLAKKTCMTRGEWIARTGIDPLVKQ